MISNSEINTSKNYIHTIDPDKTYLGKIKTIMPYGVFIEILPGVEGILDINKVKETVKGILKEGQQVEVKLIGMINKTAELGLINQNP